MYRASPRRPQWTAIPPVPAGFAFGLPLGLSFVGPAGSEGKLIGYGHAYEQATRHCRAPAFAAAVRTET